MNVLKPEIGEWYRGATNALFEVVAIDDADETIEIQYFDGTIEEMDFDSWNAMLMENAIEAADAPEDWSGSVDVDTEDLGREFEDTAQPQWSKDSSRLTPRLR
jgi:hypothetical protein